MITKTLGKDKNNKVGSVGSDEGETLEELRDDAKKEDTDTQSSGSNDEGDEGEEETQSLVLKILREEKRTVVKMQVLGFKVGLSINILLLICHSISHLMMQWIRIAKIGLCDYPKS